MFFIGLEVCRPHAENHATFFCVYCQICNFNPVSSGLAVSLTPCAVYSWEKKSWTTIPQYSMSVAEWAQTFIFFLTWSPVSGILCWCLWQLSESSGGFLSVLKKLDEWQCIFLCPLYSWGTFKVNTGTALPCCVEPLEARYVGGSWTLPSKREQSKIACSDLAPRVVRWLCTECLPHWSPCLFWEGWFLVMHGGGCLADPWLSLFISPPDWQLL